MRSFCGPFNRTALIDCGNNFTESITYGNVVEDMAKNSSDYINAFKSYLLEYTKQKDDNNTKNMLDIIYDTSRCDLGIINNIGNIAGQIKNSNSPFDYINKNLTSIIAEINLINSKITAK